MNLQKSASGVEEGEKKKKKKTKKKKKDQRVGDGGRGSGVVEMTGPRVWGVKCGNFVGEGGREAENVAIRGTGGRCQYGQARKSREW